MLCGICEILRSHHASGEAVTMLEISKLSKMDNMPCRRLLYLNQHVHVCTLVCMRIKMRNVSQISACIVFSAHRLRYVVQVRFGVPWLLLSYTAVAHAAAMAYTHTPHTVHYYYTHNCLPAIVRWNECFAFACTMPPCAACLLNIAMCL